MNESVQSLQSPAVRRVVTKLSPKVYVDLYAVKLRTGRSLQSLVEEAIQIVIAANRVARAGEAAESREN